MDSSIVAIVATVTAVISPTAALIINHCFDLKKRRLELAYDKMYTAFVEVTKTYWEMRGIRDTDSRFKFSIACHNASFFVDSETAKELALMAMFASDNSLPQYLDTVEDFYDKCLIKLGTVIQESKLKHKRRLSTKSDNKLHKTRS